MDIKAGTILDLTVTIDKVGHRIFEDTIAVASGKKTVRAEEPRLHIEFKVWGIAVAGNMRGTSARI
jgi:altronate dehydratase